MSEREPWYAKSNPSIQDRLRQDCVSTCRCLTCEAADAIDRLEAELRALKAQPEPCDRCELDRDGFGYQGMLPKHTCEPADAERARKAGT